MARYKKETAPEDLVIHSQGPSQGKEDYRYQSQLDFWKRDEGGLLPIEYIFKDDEPNKIDWYKMIPKKFIVPNRDKFPKDTNFKSLDITEIDDSKLLILLGGFRYLSSLRGFNYIKQSINFAYPDFVAMTCEIELIPNLETSMQSKIFIGEADAHSRNTHSFAVNYLTCIAGNRAFARAWRNALEIPVLSFDEVGPNNNSENTNNSETAIKAGGPHAALLKKIQEKGRSFEQLKKYLIKTHADFLKENELTEEMVLAWQDENKISIPIVIKILGILSN